MEERIQKIIAAAGVCSRRAAEELLTEGRVRVNGAVAALGGKADPERDTVTVDGVPLRRPEQMVYLMLNKPVGCVTTLSDEKGRPTVAELVADCGTRVFPVGRLDLMSEGLLLLTNDGALMQRLTHPSHEVAKTYRVTVSGQLDGAAERMAALRALDGGEAIRPAEVSLRRRSAGTAELEVIIRQGKNRQVRRMCALCGLSVRRLRRIREDGLSLGDLKPGKWRYLTDAEVRSLKKT